jgi:hypothetical protein
VPAYVSIYAYTYIRLHIYLNIYTGDFVGAFNMVIERGELEDLARVMEMLGPKPYVRLCLNMHVDDFM